MSKIEKAIAIFMISLIKMYQLILSPLLPCSCRFYPTCSEYGILAIKEHGPLKGLFLLFYRLFRCHPLCKGGFDPVPVSLKNKERVVNHERSN